LFVWIDSKYLLAHAFFFKANSPAESWEENRRKGIFTGKDPQLNI
jgi:hypothetical protein